jgi:transcriptional regulator with XRE-family HTH domain
MPNLNVPSLNVPGLSGSSINVRGLGDYIREQRRSAQISLRQLARQAGVSNPYLSQIERGLRKPSAEILQQIAKALRISAEALYVQAGILEERQATELAQAFLQDQYLNERQKQVLIEIYDSFRKENEARTAAEAAGEIAAAEGLEIAVSDEPVISMVDTAEPSAS